MMISVSRALELVFDLLNPLGHEEVPLEEGAGRVLAAPAIARRDQPPFAASAMDGYAICEIDAVQGKRLRVRGEAAAGHGLARPVRPGEAARIFTGAPLPEGAERVVIQENVSRDGDWITLAEPIGEGRNIRPAGADFSAGSRIEAPRLLGAADIALLAAMNIPRFEVFRRPEVALLATGDELVMPGEEPGPDQIIASNAYGLKALAESVGARARILPIARDTEADLKRAFKRAEGADLIVTIGGASVGDHDLVGQVAAALGLDRAFYKVAMRPGKPLMAGKLSGTPMLGLPGNPVSSMVCGVIFMQPALRVLQGLPPGPAPRSMARLGRDLPENGAREHYMRARLEGGTITPFERQDSALLSVLAGADALLVRPVGDGPRKAGEWVPYVALGGAH